MYAPKLPVNQEGPCLFSSLNPGCLDSLALSPWLFCLGTALSWERSMFLKPSHTKGHRDVSSPYQYEELPTRVGGPSCSALNLYSNVPVAPQWDHVNESLITLNALRMLRQRQPNATRSQPGCLMLLASNTASSTFFFLLTFSPTMQLEQGQG